MLGTGAVLPPKVLDVRADDGSMTLIDEDIDVVERQPFLGIKVDRRVLVQVRNDVGAVGSVQRFATTKNKIRLARETDQILDGHTRGDLRVVALHPLMCGRETRQDNKSGHCQHCGNDDQIFRSSRHDA